MDYNSAFQFIKRKYKNTYSNASYYTNVITWLNWYKGYLKDFHRTRIANGITVTYRDIYRLKMAKRVCEDWTSNMLNEDVQIVISGSNKKSDIFIQGSKGNGGVLGTNNFRVMFTEALEKMFALGTGAIVIDLDNITVSDDGNIISGRDGKIRLKNIIATHIIPITYNNDIIEEASFITEYVYNNKTYFIISTHLLDSELKCYVIYNDVVDESFKPVFSDIGLNILPKIITRSENPLFIIIRTNITNNIDLNSPLGISIFSEAIDNLKACDACYDSSIREVLSGQRIIMMNKCLLMNDDEGHPIAPQDYKQTYMQFFGDDALADVSEFIKEFHPSLNTDALDKELQNQLNMLSMKVGLGSDYYKFDTSKGVVKTATEAVINRSDFMRNNRKFIQLIENELKDLIKELLFVGHSILEANVEENAKIDISIADNVIEDDNARREQDRQDVRDGIMGKAEYRAKWYGETIQEAEKNIQKIQSDQEPTDDGTQNQPDEIV